MAKILWMLLCSVGLLIVTGCGQQDEHISVMTSRPQTYTPDQAVAMVKKLQAKYTADKLTVTCEGDFNGLYHILWTDSSKSKSGLDYVNDQTGAIIVATQTWVQLNDMSHGAYYVVTKEPVHKIGKLIGTVCLTCNGPTPTSNNLPSGTKVYAIAGADIKTEIAVEPIHDHYLTALWYGVEKPQFNLVNGHSSQSTASSPHFATLPSEPSSIVVTKYVESNSKQTQASSYTLTGTKMEVLYHTIKDDAQHVLPKTGAMAFTRLSNEFITTVGAR